uniref:Uncharacterized protein n=1 Tax=Anguilla anguilla TaxID=7936 RepID=A0A0E9RHL4_ANGAN
MQGGCKNIIFLLKCNMLFVI